MDVRLRAFQGRDFEFVRELYFETLRWAIERYFGWSPLQQEENFSTWFRPNEVRIITADGMDAGWIQQRQDAGEIFLASICGINCGRDPTSWKPFRWFWTHNF
jgi:hypothetical protein